MPFEIQDLFRDQKFVTVANFDYGMKSVFTLRQKNNEMPKLMKDARFGRTPPENLRTRKDTLALLPLWRYEAPNYHSHSREDFEARIGEILSQCPRFVNTLESYTRYPANTNLKSKVQSISLT